MEAEKLKSEVLENMDRFKGDEMLEAKMTVADRVKSVAGDVSFGVGSLGTLGAGLGAADLILKKLRGKKVGGLKGSLKTIGKYAKYGALTGAGVGAISGVRTSIPGIIPRKIPLASIYGVKHPLHVSRELFRQALFGESATALIRAGQSPEDVVDQMLAEGPRELFKKAKDTFGGMVTHAFGPENVEAAKKAASTAASEVSGKVKANAKAAGEAIKKKIPDAVKIGTAMYSTKKIIPAALTGLGTGFGTAVGAGIPLAAAGLGYLGLRSAYRGTKGLVKGAGKGIHHVATTKSRRKARRESDLLRNRDLARAEYELRDYKKKLGQMDEAVRWWRDPTLISSEDERRRAQMEKAKQFILNRILAKKEVTNAAI